MLKPFPISKETKLKLKKSVEQGESHFAFNGKPLLAELICCLGISQETGTINDELAKHIFDQSTGENVSLSSLRSEIVTWKGHFGVKIYSTKNSHLKLDHPQLLQLINRKFSFNNKGELKQIIFFPKAISDILSLQKIELVIVKSWALNTNFDGFSNSERFYVTNEWEIKQNDGLRMAELMSKRKLAFMGTHDLVAHIAGAKGSYWNKLQKLSNKITPVLSAGSQKSLPHLIVPYLVGILLDDLAQPAHYNSFYRKETITHLLTLQKWVIKNLPIKNKLIRYPKSFWKLIEEPRLGNFSTGRLKELIKNLSLEIQIFAR